MKVQVVLQAVLLLIYQCAVSVESRTLRKQSAVYQFPEQWQTWKSAYGKSYSSQLEELDRHLVWLSNKKYIESHNVFSDVFGYTLKLNRFADLTESDYISLQVSTDSVSRGNNVSALHSKPLAHPPSPSPRPVPDDSTLPESMDWRIKNAVTPVKNEGQCLSCYAFSALGALEGALALATGTLVDMSAQNIVDCSLPYGNHGCGGGNIVNTFMYIINNGGVDLVKEYPYKGRQGACHASSQPSHGGMSGVVSIDAGDEQQLLEAVATVGPVTAAVDATSNAFRFYSSGVLDIPQCSSERATHSVLVTGYGVLDSKKYWLVKNSWGVQWGDAGYILMSRDKYNQCAIATAASYPTL